MIEENTQYRTAGNKVVRSLDEQLNIIDKFNSNIMFKTQKQLKQIEINSFLTPTDKNEPPPWPG